MAQATREQIYDKICELLKPYNPQNRKITLQSGIVSDLEVDSVAVFDLVMELEDHYDISISMEQVSDIKTVGELVNCVKELLEG
jgi:acyl carrier protein